MLQTGTDAAQLSRLRRDADCILTDVGRPRRLEAARWNWRRKTGRPASGSQLGSRDDKVERRKTSP
jgi:hypothetical protein